MKIVIQRVSKCKVSINGKTHAEINKGQLVLLGIEEEDTETDMDFLIRKIKQLRMFDDENQIPNLSVEDIEGELMVVSQFTLHASTKKGNRPSFVKAAPASLAENLYTKFIEKLKANCELNIATGLFGANMQIDLINDGPYTLIIDSKNKV